MSGLGCKNALLSRLRIYYFLHYNQSVESSKSHAHHMIFKFSVEAAFLRVFKTSFETMNCTSLNADMCCSPVIVSLQLNYKVTNGSGYQVGGVLLTVFQ